MARAGFIRDVIIDESIETKITRIAGLCRIPESQYRYGILIAVHAILDTPQENSDAFLIQLDKVEAEFDDIIHSFRLKVKLESNKQRLVFEFSDLRDGKILNKIEMLFGNIRDGLLPYRNSLDEIERNGGSRSANLFYACDRIRGAWHNEIISSIGIDVSGDHPEYFFTLQAAKRLTTLVAEIFPKGPGQDWFSEPKRQNPPRRGPALKTQDP